MVKKIKMLSLTHTHIFTYIHTYIQHVSVAGQIIKANFNK